MARKRQRGVPFTRLTYAAGPRRYLPPPSPSASRKRLVAGDKRFPSPSPSFTVHTLPASTTATAIYPFPPPLSLIASPPPPNAAATSTPPPPKKTPAMFLTDKYHSLLPSFHPAKNARRQHHPDKAAAAAGPTARFDAALAARLRSLLPLPASPLAALARLAELLAVTLGDAAPSLAGEGDAAAVAAHLDAGVALLDACNAIAARVDRLRRRRLLSRFALHLLSSSSSASASPSPSAVRRARAELADRAAASPPPPLPSLPFDQPRGGRHSAAARVLLAVDAVSSLASSAAAAVLGAAAAPLETAAFPLVSGGELPWAEAFNAVSTQLATLVTTTGEVDAIDEAVGKLASVLDSSEGGDTNVDAAALRAATQEVEKRSEELAARLDRLSDAVNGVFRAALCLRNAELGCFMVEESQSAEKACKKY